MDRRDFLGSAALAGLAAPASAAALRADQPAGAAGTDTGFSLATPDADVAAVVGGAHRGLDPIRELVEGRPELAGATIDWGFGDWESALGAASHTGQREAAEFLIRHGARPDQFALAMLGRVDALRAIVEAVPGLHRARGPHDISLLAHARAGGDQAAACVEYLTELGGADDPLPAEPLSDTDADTLAGTYALQGRQGRFRIERTERGLRIRAGDGPPRGLRHEGRLLFRPAGARSVFLQASVSAAPTILCEIPAGKRWWAKRVGD